MSIDYDRALSDAKDACTRDLCAKEFDKAVLARSIDNLNKAWDELTDMLVRQRKARDQTIDHLHGQIAELEKRAEARHG